MNSSTYTLAEKSKVRTFKQRVKQFHKKSGRHDLPWRVSHDPYRVLVSEIMLQQTQVPRVIPKYREFLERFPTLTSLADAPLQDVLRIWSGLGYNRRARMLQQAAQYVQTKHSGIFPSTTDELKNLPGVGPYTAGAVAAFAFNKKVSMIETNIRTVFIHEFFPDSQGVKDSDLMPLIEACVATERNPREWYAALMDYGTHIKQTLGNSSRQSKHHTKQSAFKGSLREVRGEVVSLLVTKPRTQRQIEGLTGFSPERVAKALAGLTRDGLAVKKGVTWCVAT